MIKRLLSLCAVALGAACGGRIDADSTSSPSPTAAGKCDSAAAPETPTVFASTKQEPETLAIDRQNLYFVDEDGLEKEPLGGGAKTTLATGMVNVQHIAVDANNVYWADSDQSLIESVSIARGNPTILATNAGVSALVVSPTNVYWATADLTTSALVTVPSGGGSPTTLSTGTEAIEDIAFDSTNVYWDEGEAPAVIEKTPVGGGAVTVLASVDAAYEMVVDGADLIWISDSAITKMPTVGGSSEPIVSRLLVPGFLQIDDAENLYWKEVPNSTTDGIFRASISGDCVQTLVSTDSWLKVGVFVVGPDKVYWVDNDDGKIYSVAR